MKISVTSICSGALFLASAAIFIAPVHAQDLVKPDNVAALAQPAPPTVEIKGAPGQNTVYYWAFARDARGHSKLSAPVVVKNAPAQLSAQNAVVLTPVPVAGATEYGILSSRIAAPRDLKINIKKKGEQTYYYWLQVRSGATVYSPISGPFKAEKSARVPDTDLSWDAVPGAQAYFVYRSETPDVPVGWRNVALAAGLVQTSFNDQVPIPVSAIIRPAGNASDIPQGEGNYLIGVSQGAPIIDAGQAATSIAWYDINTTDPNYRPVKPDIKGWDQSVGNAYQFDSYSTMPVPKVGWGHVEGLSVTQRNIAGGINRQPFSGAEGGTIPQESAKNSHIALGFHQHNYTASQKAGVLGYTHNYGVGDNVGVVLSQSQYGQNRDGGDEGSEFFSYHMNRFLSMNRAKIGADAATGDIYLKTEGAIGNVAAGRGIVNLSRAYKSGQAKVGGVTKIENGDKRTMGAVVIGNGTAWTPQMEGWWISFDADTVKGGGQDVRQWYRVERYISPTELKLFAYTYWATTAYKGKAYENGGYLLCPYTEIVDGDSLTPDGLRVVPLNANWKAGDSIELMAGPQTTMRLGWWEMGGEFLPQDHVAGLGIMYNGNKDPSEGALIVYGNPNGRWPSALEMHNLKGGLNFGQVDVGLTFDSFSNTILYAIHDPTRFMLKKDEKGIYLDGVAAPSPENIGRFVGLTTDGLAVYKGGLKGNERTRGQSTFSGDGTKTQFTIKFPIAHPSAPFIVASSNLPLGMGVTATTPQDCVVAFAQAPAAGENNVVVTWMVQE